MAQIQALEALEADKDEKANRRKDEFLIEIARSFIDNFPLCESYLAKSNCVRRALSEASMYALLFNNKRSTLTRDLATCVIYSAQEFAQIPEKN